MNLIALISEIVHVNLLQLSVVTQLVDDGGVWYAEHTINDVDNAVLRCNVRLDDCGVDTAAIDRQRAIVADQCHVEDERLLRIQRCCLVILSINYTL